jgi:hypothetical protein
MAAEMEMLDAVEPEPVEQTQDQEPEEASTEELEGQPDQSQEDSEPQENAGAVQSQQPDIRAIIGEAMAGLATEMRKNHTNLSNEFNQKLQQLQRAQGSGQSKSKSIGQVDQKSEWDDLSNWVKKGLDPEFAKWFMGKVDSLKKENEDLRSEHSKFSDGMRIKEDGARIENHLKTGTEKAYEAVKMPERFKKYFEHQITADAFRGEDVFKMDLVGKAKAFMKDIADELTDREKARTATAQANLGKTGSAGGKSVPTKPGFKQGSFNKKDPYAGIRAAARKFTQETE